MTHANWLASLKVGDEVGLSGGWHMRFARIARETPHYWIVEGDRYRKDTGRRVLPRGSRNFSSLHQPTQDLKDDHDARRLAHELGGIGWRNKPVGLLRAVKALLEHEAQHVTEVRVYTQLDGATAEQHMPGWKPET